MRPDMKKIQIRSEGQRTLNGERNEWQNILKVTGTKHTKCKANRKAAETLGHGVEGNTLKKEKNHGKRAWDNDSELLLYCVFVSLNNNNNNNKNNKNNKNNNNHNNNHNNNNNNCSKPILTLHMECLNLVYNARYVLLYVCM